MKQWWEGDSTDTAVRVPPEIVREAATALLVDHGVPQDDAMITARQLVEGDLRGHPSHGVSRLCQVTEMFREETLRSKPARSRSQAAMAAGIIDGDGGLGPPAMAEAIVLAREIVASQGVAIVGVRNAGHLGILGTWAEQLAADDCFAIVVSSSEPGVVVPGSATPVFGTNPIAYSWPTATANVTADFSTSALTRSELLRRAETGEALPPGSATGADGSPTTDPKLALKGGLLPFGSGHKGVLVSLLASVLAGPLVGGPANHLVTGTRWSGAPPNKADFLLAVRLDALTTTQDFETQTSAFLSELASAESFHRPGSAAFARRESAMSTGIEVPGPAARLLWPEQVA